MHKRILIFGVLALLGLLIIIPFMWGFSSNDTKDTTVQTFVEDTIGKKESLPAPSSLVEDEETKLTVTAHELIKGISKNNIKQNIEEYFGKFADITGTVKRIDEKRDGIHITLDGETECKLGYVMCKIAKSTLEDVSDVSIGDEIIISGQIKALAEIPGDEVQDQLLLQSAAQIIKPCNIK